MQTNMKRRLFLKASLATGAVGLAAGAGLLTPRTVLAEWNSAAFAAENVADALKAGLGSDAVTDSAEIKLDIPKNPENGAVVPVAATTTLTGVESIALLVDKNVKPLCGIFYPGKLIFALPMAFYWRFKLYVLLHIGLAAVAAHASARLRGAMAGP